MSYFLWFSSHSGYCGWAWICIYGKRGKLTRMERWGYPGSSILSSILLSFFTCSRPFHPRRGFPNTTPSCLGSKWRAYDYGEKSIVSLFRSIFWLFSHWSFYLKKFIGEILIAFAKSFLLFFYFLFDAFWKSNERILRLLIPWPVSLTNRTLSIV